MDRQQQKYQKPHMQEGADQWRNKVGRTDQKHPRSICRHYYRTYNKRCRCSTSATRYNHSWLLNFQLAIAQLLFLKGLTGVTRLVLSDRPMDAGLASWPTSGLNIWPAAVATVPPALAM
jgi:hypothetical protein